MILALGARGPGFNSRTGPQLSFELMKNKIDEIHLELKRSPTLGERFLVLKARSIGFIF